MALKATIQLAGFMLLSVMFNGNELCHAGVSSHGQIYSTKQHHADHSQTNEEDTQEH